MIGEIIILSLFGLFFTGLAIFQFKNGVLLSGRGSASPLADMERSKNKVMVYIFSSLELVVGIAAFVLVAVSVVGHLSHIGSCYERKSKLKCTEYSTGWTQKELRDICPNKPSSERCEKENILGICKIESKGKIKHEFYYAGTIVSGSDFFTPTKEDSQARCKKKHGQWER